MVVLCNHVTTEYVTIYRVANCSCHEMVTHNCVMEAVLYCWWRGATDIYLIEMASRPVADNNTGCSDLKIRTATQKQYPTQVFSIPRER